MVVLPLLLTALCVVAGVAGDQAVERQHILSISAPDIDGGILSEITWDNGAILMQGVVANPDGSLAARYVVIPARGTTLARLKAQTDPSILSSASCCCRNRSGWRNRSSAERRKLQES